MKIAQFSAFENAQAARLIPHIYHVPSGYLT